MGSERFEGENMADSLEQEFESAKLVPEYVKEMGLSDDFETAMTRESFYIRHAPCGSVIKIPTDLTRPNIVQRKATEHLANCSAAK
jgi:hypothetical protein